ncbi:carbamoyltransferase family protein [Acrocarpospora catenulata]|uniref:carbamoyltransferase family protein n=1 Tax=Acrocarpospora catenulata TaxID=2836182 RepID=UPI001BD99203|nr:carbamoyltransferase C-terminal domain-containing protein [Acrocarpospora catenulata]
MRILGISGLHNSEEFKRRELPGLSEREYRVSQGRDSAAALVVDGKIVAAAAEERFTGEKSTGSFPVNAMRDCLDRAGLRLADIDLIGHGFAHEPSELEAGEEYLARRYREVYDPAVQLRWLAEHFPGENFPGENFPGERSPGEGFASRFVPVPHHLAHAASAYYASGFDDCLVLVADGRGETECLTVYTGIGGKLEPLHSVPALHSLGTLYGVFTLYLGFEMALDEYKMMGLASYGDRTRYERHLRQMINLRPGGPEYSIPLLARDGDLLQRETHRGVLAVLEETFGPARIPGGPIEQHHMDIAAAAQGALERCLLHVLRHYRRQTGLRDLCYAGGVALNCTANSLILRSRLFDRVFVPPGAGDDGTAVGAALYLHATRKPETPITPMVMPYWGTSFSSAEIAEHLATRTDCGYRHVPDQEELLADTAAALDRGEVVAWFQGGMEFGPRALGNRSILADPREARMRDHINNLIKKREDFRPFAPVVKEEAAAELFEIRRGRERQYAHMLFTTRTRPEHREHLGAVTHIDGTARVQAVSRAGNPRLWELLTAFGARTGVPALLNTSFNLRGQPIVRTPREAVDTFLRGGLDRLVIGDHVVLPGGSS